MSLELAKNWGDAGLKFVATNSTTTCSFRIVAIEPARTNDAPPSGQSLARIEGTRVVVVGMWAGVVEAGGKTKVRKAGKELYIYILAHTKFHTKTLRVVSAR